MPEKMEIKKFDPKIRQHVIFKEAKINLECLSHYDYITEEAVKMNYVSACDMQHRPYTKKRVWDKD